MNGKWWNVSPYGVRVFYLKGNYFWPVSEFNLTCAYFFMNCRDYTANWFMLNNCFWLLPGAPDTGIS